MRIENDKCKYIAHKKCYFNIFRICVYNIFNPEYTYELISCGGKGFAAVFHTGGYNAGSSGAGLGY